MIRRKTNESRKLTLEERVARLEKMLIKNEGNASPVKEFIDAFLANPEVNPNGLTAEDIGMYTIDGMTYLGYDNRGHHSGLNYLGVKDDVIRTVLDELKKQFKGKLTVFTFYQPPFNNYIGVKLNNYTDVKPLKKPSRRRSSDDDMWEDPDYQDMRRGRGYSKMQKNM